jgi:hypothetical protein
MVRGVGWDSPASAQQKRRKQGKTKRDVVYCSLFFLFIFAKENRCIMRCISFSIQRSRTLFSNIHVPFFRESSTFAATHQNEQVLIIVIKTACSVRQG